MSESALSFIADTVSAHTTEYTPECIVYLIAFGTGASGAGEHSWNFSRSFDDDWGVCTVREVQQSTVYGGIDRFVLRRTEVECHFDSKAAAELGVGDLKIVFTINDEAWRKVAENARVIFRDCPFFSCCEDCA